MLNAKLWNYKKCGWNHHPKFAPPLKPEKVLKIKVLQRPFLKLHWNRRGCITFYGETSSTRNASTAKWKKNLFLPNSFQSPFRYKVKGVSAEDRLKSWSNGKVSSGEREKRWENWMCAIRVAGSFNYLRDRAPPKVGVLLSGDSGSRFLVDFRAGYSLAKKIWFFIQPS